MFASHLPYRTIIHVTEQKRKKNTYNYFLFKIKKTQHPVQIMAMAIGNSFFLLLVSPRSQLNRHVNVFSGGLRTPLVMLCVFGKIQLARIKGEKP